VRLPKEYRFDADEVRIRRHGSAIILEPIPKDWGWLRGLAGPVDADFVQAVNEAVPPQQRPELDFFK
jgi:antitoxin VapB